MQEEWKTVEEWPEYDVSNLGRIFSKKRNKVANLRVDKDGYVMVNLSNKGVYKRVGVHRLVALAFVEGYFDGAHVKFKDGDRSNCEASNLEWQKPHNQGVINGYGVRVLAGRTPREIFVQNPDTMEFEWIHPLYIQPFKDRGLIPDDWTRPTGHN